MNRLNNDSSDSQSSFFPDHEIDLDKVIEIQQKLKIVDCTNLRILKCISNFPGISSKELSKQVHLERSQISNRTKYLEKLELIKIKTSNNEKSNIKPPLFYSVIKGIKKFDIIDEIFERENQNDIKFINKMNLSEDLEVPEDPEDSEELKPAKNIKELNDRIKSLSDREKEILIYVCDNPRLDSLVLSNIIGLTPPSINRYFLNLRKLKLIEHDKSNSYDIFTKTRKRTPHFLANNYNEETVKKVIEYPDAVTDDYPLYNPVEGEVKKSIHFDFSKDYSKNSSFTMLKISELFKDKEKNEENRRVIEDESKVIENEGRELEKRMEEVNSKKYKNMKEDTRIINQITNLKRQVVEQDGIAGLEFAEKWIQILENEKSN